MDKFHYLKVSLAVLLAVVGTKMILHKPLKEALGDNVHFYLLGLTVLILGAGVVASLVSNRRKGGGDGDATSAEPTKKALGVKDGEVVAGPIS
jgi:predicted tellurium resistance membrane protein TerC